MIAWVFFAVKGFGRVMDKRAVEPGAFALLKQAVVRAQEAHRGQVRKGREREPFYNHPRRVCKRYLKFQHKTLNGAVAALCHDVVEDTPLTLDDVECWFGAEVRDQVGNLTKPRSLSHKEYLVDFPAWPLEVKKIKLCDIEDNIVSSRTIVPEYRGNMLVKWKRYLHSLDPGKDAGGAEGLEYRAMWTDVLELCYREIETLAGETS